LLSEEEATVQSWIHHNDNNKYDRGSSKSNKHKTVLSEMRFPKKKNTKK